MRAFFTLLFCCLAYLVAGRYADRDTYNAVLQARKLDLYLKSAQPLSEQNYIPHINLVRRGTGRKKSGSPVRGKSEAGPSHIQIKGSHPPSPQPKGQPSISKAYIEGHGPADIWAYNSARPGGFQDWQHRYVPPDQEHVMHTEYHPVAIAGGEAPPLPPPDARRQSTSTPPLKAQGQGRTAVARVVAPVGGYGHIKAQTPAGIENLPVPGGESKIHEVHVPGRDDAKIEATVTRGGKVSAGGQALDRTVLNDRLQNA